MYILICCISVKWSIETGLMDVFIITNTPEGNYTLTQLSK